MQRDFAVQPQRVAILEQPCGTGLSNLDTSKMLPLG